MAEADGRSRRKPIFRLTMVKTRLKTDQNDGKKKTENETSSSTRQSIQKRAATSSLNAPGEENKHSLGDVPPKKAKKLNADRKDLEKTKGSGFDNGSRTRKRRQKIDNPTMLLGQDSKDGTVDAIRKSDKTKINITDENSVLTETRYSNLSNNIQQTCTEHSDFVDENDTVRQSKHRVNLSTGSDFRQPLGEDQFLDRLLSQGFKSRVREPVIQTCRAKLYSDSSVNLMHCLSQTTMGCKSRFKLMQSLKSPIKRIVSDLSLFQVCSPFDRRVTALEWHPTQHNILAVGSKGGDIVQMDVNNLNDAKSMIKGIGAAGSCQAVKFWPWDLSKMVSASINGTVTLHNFEIQQNTILADTMNSYDHWYTSLDVNAGRYMVAAGRNGGILHLMSSEGNKIFENKLHKGKITHVEFSPREEWLLCTASIDKTVALWDIRHIKDRKSNLDSLEHNKPVNSAYFSRTDGCRLLTTDQGNEMRVYASPEWNQPTIVSHPHRFFQHITPFKATWHPLKDVIVCGRYPDPNFSGVVEQRSVDVMDADTGYTIYQLQHPGVSGLCPLNKFNNCGDMMASGMGYHIMMWKQPEASKKAGPTIVTKLSSKFLGQSRDTGSQGDRSQSSRRPRSGKQKKMDDDTDDLKKQKKTKVAESSTLKLKTKKDIPKKEKD